MGRLRLYIEVFVVALFVLVSTYLIYRRLAHVEFFWSAQFLWSAGLAFCWIIVAFGYYHQGVLVRHDHNAAHVSIVLPIAVFFVQLILFVKGIYYNDWSLVWGAIVVNSGVLFSLYQIIFFRY